MIPDEEPLLTLPEVPRLPRLARGRASAKLVSYFTIHRWATRGVKGHRLETVRLAGRISTSEGAVNRFLDAINEGTTTPGPTAAPAIAPTRAIQVDAALQKLRRPGQLVPRLRQAHRS